MCAAYTLPADLAPEEAATVEAFRARAVREATERAALAVRVQREFRKLRRRGMTYEGALDWIDGDPDIPVTRGTAKRIVERRGAWAA